MSSAPRSPFPAAWTAGLVFLGAQLVLAVVPVVSDNRLVHLTPFAGPTAYRLNVSVTGRALSDAQLRARYGLAFRGHTQLTPEALQRVVIEREGSDAAAAAGELFVRLHTSRQGGPEEIWLWPQR